MNSRTSLRMSRMIARPDLTRVHWPMPLPSAFYLGGVVPWRWRDRYPRETQVPGWLPVRGGGGFGVPCDVQLGVQPRLLAVFTDRWLDDQAFADGVSNHRSGCDDLVAWPCARVSCTAGSIGAVVVVLAEPSHEEGVVVVEVMGLQRAARSAFVHRRRAVPGAVYAAIRRLVCQSLSRGRPPVIRSFQEGSGRDPAWHGRPPIASGYPRNLHRGNRRYAPAAELRSVGGRGARRAYGCAYEIASRPDIQPPLAAARNPHGCRRWRLATAGFSTFARTLNPKVVGSIPTRPMVGVGGSWGEPAPPM